MPHWKMGGSVPHEHKPNTSMSLNHCHSLEWSNAKLEIMQYKNSGLHSLLSLVMRYREKIYSACYSFTSDNTTHTHN